MSRKKIHLPSHSSHNDEEYQLNSNYFDSCSINSDSYQDSKNCCIDKKMILSKLFYFFFFFAYGSLLPYLALHFKQMLLTPTEVGILMGVKPFISFVVNPIWGIIVDKFKIGKAVLLLSMTALVVSGTAIVFVPGPKDTMQILSLHCNRTNETLLNPWMIQRNFITPHLKHSRPSSRDFSFAPKYFRFNEYEWPIDWIKTFNSHNSSHSNEYEQNSSARSNTTHTNFNTTEQNNTNSTSSTALKEFKVDASLPFFRIFVLIFVGTLVGSPALAIVDTTTIKLLGKESEKYGKQRLSGSLGWGIGAFFVGASLTATHKCILHRNIDLIDYTPCFIAYFLSMTLGTLICLGFKIDDHNEKSESVIDVTEIYPENDKSKKGSMGNFVVCMQVIKKPTYLIFLFTALLMGFEMAFVKTFLFWHLKEMGATQLLFSVVSAVNCVAEVSMYFFVGQLISIIGQKSVIYLALLCYSIRLFYYAYLPSPWWVLLVELLPGITTAGAWAACLSYVNSKTANTNFKTTMQCILHSAHWGLGYGLGEVVGGIMVHMFGTKTSFIINGVVCLVNLVVYILIEKICADRVEKESKTGQTKKRAMSEGDLQSKNSKKKEKNFSD